MPVPCESRYPSRLVGVERLCSALLCSGRLRPAAMCTFYLPSHGCHGISEWGLVNCPRPRIPFFLSFPFDLIASLPLLNKDTVDMSVWRMLTLLAASKQWYCIGFKQDSIDAADLLAWPRHSSIVLYRHGIA